MLQDTKTVQFTRSELLVNKEPSIVENSTISEADYWKQHKNYHRNDLINCARTIIAVLTSLPKTRDVEEPEQLYQYLLELILDFKHRAQLCDYHQSMIEKSCFILSAALDEAIQHTEWGERIKWERYSLVNKLFSYRNAGEVFFEVLEQALQRTEVLEDFLELQHLILSLGFRGKYRDTKDSEFEELKASLTTFIKKRHYPIKKLDLFLNRQMLDSDDIHQGWKKYRVTPIVILTLVASAFMFFISEKSLSQGVERVKSHVSEINKDFSSKNITSPLLNTIENKSNIKSSWKVAISGNFPSNELNVLKRHVNEQGYNFHFENETLVISASSLERAKALRTELKIKFGINAIVQGNN